MDSNTLLKISTQIYKRFPEVTGVQPKIRSQQPGPGPMGQSETGLLPEARIYLLTYHTTVSGPGGITIPRWVRVTTDMQGRIIKISTSH
jgi:hypothetical protein